MRTKLSLTLVLGLAVLVSTASATLMEIEPSALSGVNDTTATADPIMRGPVLWVDAGIMHLAPGGGDVDFFSIELAEGEIMMATVTPLVDLFFNPDTIIAIFDDGGAQLAINDDVDVYTNLGSKVDWQAQYSGTYYIGVTGYDDYDFNGYSDAMPAEIHGEAGAYMMAVAITPEPTMCVLLGLGSLVFMKKKRRS